VSMMGNLGMISPRQFEIVIGGFQGQAKTGRGTAGCPI
jgi:hypothetical protein